MDTSSAFSVEVGRSADECNQGWGNNPELWSVLEESDGAVCSTDKLISTLWKESLTSSLWLWARKKYPEQWD